MKRTIAALAIATFSSSAFAADLGGEYKNPEYPVTGTAVRWTGAYIGVEAGYAFGNADALATGDVRSRNVLTVDEQGLSLTGMTGDVTLGYDYHIPASRWVFGVFGDYVFGKADYEKTTTISVPTLGTNSFSVGGSIENQWKLGGRVGVIVTPGAIAYMKAGWTQADLNISHSSTIPTLLPDAAYNSPSMNGWLLGGGIEAHVGSGVFVRAEYNYSNFGRNIVIDNAALSPIIHLTQSVDVDEHTAKVGLVYKPKLEESFK